VKAKDDVRVVAKASEDVILVGVGLAGGTVGVGAGLNVLSLNGETKASVGGVVRAEGDLVVRAEDDTGITIVSGGLGVGYVGVGAGVGVMVINKDTEAFIANGADITALGRGATGETVRDGGIASGDFTTATAHGVILDARYTEAILNLSIAGGGEFVGASGSVAVTLISSKTQALIGDADVNKVNTIGALSASGDQDVFVTATNKVEVKDLALAVAGGFVGVGGAVDVGTLNNDTSARINDGADVHAADDVEINGASIKTMGSIVISGAGGFVGLAGSVSAWSIGEQLNKDYSSRNQDGSTDQTGNALEKNKKDSAGDPDNKASVDDDAQGQSTTGRKLVADPTNADPSK